MYAKTSFVLAVSWVPPDTCNPVGTWGDHPPSLNTTQRPIVNQYREGMAKRTPWGEWNRTWNLVPTSTESSSMSDRVPFVEWSGELMYLARLRSFASQPQGNQVLIGRFSHLHQTRNRVTYPCPGWSEGNSSWRTEPTTVEMLADEVWIAEKFQSNPEIAGSLRNSFRASLVFIVPEVKHWMG